MIDKKNITGIILAGGKSSRMGADKGFLSLKGSLFTECVISAMRPLVLDIMIVSSNSDYDEFGFQRVKDLIPDSGPLGGLYSGLYHSKTDYNMVLSCDVPLIKTELLEQLISNDHMSYEVVQLRSHGKTMPLIALYQKKCMDGCRELLDRGERRLRLAVDQFNTLTIDIDAEWDQYVKNINTIEQFLTIQNEVEH